MTPCRENPSKSYGRIRVNGKRTSLHRWIVEQVEGPLLPGEVVRHKCDNPPCFLYEHLERGTKADNSRDMVERGRSGRKTRCINDHPLSGANLRVNARGTRACRACDCE